MERSHQETYRVMYWADELATMAEPITNNFNRTKVAKNFVTS